MAENEATELWDVVIVGAGPAGATAARTAAQAGATVLLIDKASFPRYKTCGGGLIGTSWDALAPQVRAQSDYVVNSIGFSRNTGRTFRRSAPDRILTMVQRDAFDQANVDAAVEDGATFRDKTRVTGLHQPESDLGPQLVTVFTEHGELSAKVVIGADGAGGRIGRYVGVIPDRVDLGLEVEYERPSTDTGRDAALLDWGRNPGTYAWLFPKKDSLTVGVIQQKGFGEQTRDYLDQWSHRLGFDDLTQLRASGHLTQWRATTTPMVRGSVALAGETAGLLEPWTREGISFALRSGKWAGQAAAEAAKTGTLQPLAKYEAQIETQLQPEIKAGARLLTMFEKHPALVHWTLLTVGFDYFVRVCRGYTSLARALRHRSIQFALRIVGV